MVFWFDPLTHPFELVALFGHVVYMNGFPRYQLKGDRFRQGRASRKLSPICIFGWKVSFPEPIRKRNRTKGRVNVRYRVPIICQPLICNRLTKLVDRPSGAFRNASHKASIAANRISFCLGLEGVSMTAPRRNSVGRDCLLRRPMKGPDPFEGAFYTSRASNDFRKDVKSQYMTWLLLGNILHFCLLWFSGKSPLKCY